MNRLALILLPLLVFAAGNGNVKIVKFGKLTIECFFPECEAKLKEVDGFIAENGIDGMGNIMTIAFSNWWSKPTVEGRVIINMYDTPQIIVSFLERHGSSARTALYDFRDIQEDLRQKYDVELACERRTVAVRCAEVAKQIRDSLTASEVRRLKPIPQTMEIVAIDWNVDKSTPKATIFGILKGDGRRYQIKDILTQQDVQMGFVSNKIFLEN